MAKDGGSPTIIKDEKHHEKPKGLLDAISELEYFHTQETRGVLLDGGFFTTKDKLVYMELGFRSTFLSGIIMALLTPFMIGVIEKMIPIFGTAEPTLIDKAFMLLLTLSYLIGYGYFLGWAARSFYSEYTHSMVKNLLSGIIGAAVLKIVIIFLAFHFIYIKVLTEANIFKMMAYAAKTFGAEKVAPAYQWLLEFREVFLTSAWFVTITTIIFVAIILGCYLSALNRNKKLKEAGIL